MNLVRIVLKYSTYSALILSIVLAFTWPFFEKHIGDIDLPTFAGIFLSIGLSFLAYFDQKIDAIFSQREVIRNLGLADAIKTALAHNGNVINQIRVYAITTEVILPIFRDSDCRIKNCFVMLHHFCETGPIQDARQLNNFNKQMERRWEELRSKGKIENVEVIRYSDRPHEYAIIMNDNCLIYGSYLYNDKSSHGNDYENPCLILRKDHESAMVIKKARIKFDDSWNYWNIQQNPDNK